MLLLPFSTLSFHWQTLGLFYTFSSITFVVIFHSYLISDVMVMIYSSFSFCVVIPCVYFRYLINHLSLYAILNFHLLPVNFVRDCGVFCYLVHILVLKGGCIMYDLNIHFKPLPYDADVGKQVCRSKQSLLVDQQTVVSQLLWFDIFVSVCKLQMFIFRI